MAASKSTIDLLALCRVPGVSWEFIARTAQDPDGLAGLLRGRAAEENKDAYETMQLLKAAKREMVEHRRTVRQMLKATEAEGARLSTVLDDDYPVNLRTIHNLPPFLFYRGQLRDEDARSVAVVGRRDPSREGVTRASKLSAHLAENDVTVLSGLARGIDTAAHEACLEAGGRTIAVLGSGLRRVYPAENRELAERIVEHGAVVSQFWPDAPPTSYSFPRRNVVMSGLGQGTVVVEASRTSGAKMQARLALEHGKKVFLLDSLIKGHAWAKDYEARGAIRVKDVRDILKMLRDPEAIQEETNERLQLNLAIAL